MNSLTTAANAKQAYCLIFVYDALHVVLFSSSNPSPSPSINSNTCCGVTSFILSAYLASRCTMKP